MIKQKISYRTLLYSLGIHIASLIIIAISLAITISILNQNQFVEQNTNSENFSFVCIKRETITTSNHSLIYCSKSQILLNTIKESVTYTIIFALVYLKSLLWLITIPIFAYFFKIFKDEPLDTLIILFILILMVLHLLALFYLT